MRTHILKLKLKNNKGVVGLRFEYVNGLKLRNVSVSDVTNRASFDKALCHSHAPGKLDSFMGGDARGLAIAESADVRMQGVSIEGVHADGTKGNAVGFEEFGKVSHKKWQLRIRDVVSKSVGGNSKSFACGARNKDNNKVFGGDQDKHAKALKVCPATLSIRECRRQEMCKVVRTADDFSQSDFCTSGGSESFQAVDAETTAPCAASPTDGAAADSPSCYSGCKSPLDATLPEWMQGTELVDQDWPWWVLRR